MIGVPVGEQHRPQPQAVGAQQRQRAAGGAGPGVDDERGAARRGRQDVAVGREDGGDRALEDHGTSLVGIYSC